MDFTRKITGSTQERGDRMSYPNIERLGPESSKKKIPSYPDYEIDQDGNVFKNDKMIAFYFTENGYKQIPLRNNKIRKHVYVHGLVAETFIGPKPKGKQTAHIEFYFGCAYWKQIPDKIEDVHVIEYSAYEELERKLGIAREALEFYANRETWRARVEHRALLCDFLMPEWGVIAQDSNGETARKALKEIEK